MSRKYSSSDRADLTPNPGLCLQLYCFVRTPAHGPRPLSKLQVSPPPCPAIGPVQWAASGYGRTDDKREPRACPWERPDAIVVLVRIFFFPRAGKISGVIFAIRSMGLCLSKLSPPTPGCLLRSERRVFALLGKATPSGLAVFGREDVSRSWALTAEFGCLRLERLTGEEEVTGQQLFLPLPADYDYGIAGPDRSPQATRAVFGLLAAELEQVVSALRRGSFPVLGFSSRDLRCSLTGCIIPGYWPHVVTSNMALNGNVVSLEAFVRLIVASLPQGRLRTCFPDLQPVFQHMIRLAVAHRRGIPYSREMLELAPVPAPAKSA